eukprot:5841674-Prymnesium_polylepis.1
MTFVKETALLPFHFFDLSAVHVSALVPQGGPMQGGTQVVVLGTCFADYNVHCRFEGTVPLVRAVLLKSSALQCTTPVQPAAASMRVEVTLNGDDALHSFTSDAVSFAFFNASVGRIEAVAPLGGPSEGGTLVMLTGSGFVDHGGVNCRFGASQASVVEATLLSARELACTSPPYPNTLFPLDAADSYTPVAARATCCTATSILASVVGTVAPGGARRADACHAGCTALDRCRYFSHSHDLAACTFCDDCAYVQEGEGSLYASWRRVGPSRAPVALGLMTNGLRVNERDARVGRH